MYTQIILYQLYKKHFFLKTIYPLDTIGLFGLYGRNEQTELRNIDLIVSFKKPTGMKLIDLTFEQEEILKHKVDL